ncbi:MAG: T9SS type A sorting domain-containing protein [Bacteroidota bacterium]
MYDALSPGNFKNVMEMNLPVSSDVYPCFHERLNNIPVGIASYLKQLQAYNPYIVTAEVVQRLIDWNTSIRTSYLSDILNQLLDTADYRKSEAIILLENEGSVDANELLAAVYLADGNYIEASNKLNTLPVSIPEVEKFVQLHQILLSLYQQDKLIYAMDSTDLDFVRNLAYECPPHRAVFSAQSILEKITGEQVPDCPVEEGTKSLKFPTKEFSENYNEIIYLGENYPDPVSDITIIPFGLSKDTEGKIIIKDILGKVIADFSVKSDNDKIKINCSSWAAGQYMYCLEVDGKQIDCKKIVK